MQRRHNGQPRVPSRPAAPYLWKSAGVIEARAASPRYEPGVYMRNVRVSQTEMVYITRTHWFEMQAYALARALGVKGIIYPEYARDMMRALKITGAEWEEFEKEVAKGTFLLL